MELLFQPKRILINLLRILAEIPWVFYILHFLSYAKLENLDKINIFGIIMPMAKQSGVKVNYIYIYR